MKIKTIRQAEELGLRTYSYKNGDWIYEDTEGYWHIFRGGEELLPEVKKLKIHSYKNRDWHYTDTDGYYHLFRDGEELLPEVKKKNIHSYPNGDWEYRDANGKYHLVKSDNIIKELEKKLELANSIIEIAVSEYGLYELYAGINKKTYDLGQAPISKEQYDYIKELKENEN